MVTYSSSANLPIEAGEVLMCPPLLTRRGDPAEVLLGPGADLRLRGASLLVGAEEREERGGEDVQPAAQAHMGDSVADDELTGRTLRW